VSRGWVEAPVGVDHHDDDRAAVDIVEDFVEGAIGVVERGCLALAGSGLLAAKDE
jgi:hypothetical protein